MSSIRAKKWEGQTNGRPSRAALLNCFVARPLETPTCFGYFSLGKEWLPSRLEYERLNRQIETTALPERREALLDWSRKQPLRRGSSAKFLDHLKKPNWAIVAGLHSLSVDVAHGVCELEFNRVTTTHSGPLPASATSTFQQRTKSLCNSSMFRKPRRKIWSNWLSKISNKAWADPSA